MDKHVNFEDSIFLLNVRLRMIQDVVILNADPGMFLRKTLDDISYIDTCFASLLDQLKNNERFLERDEQFFNLTESERIFCEILSGLNREEDSFLSAMDQEMRRTVSEIKNRSRDRIKAIDELIVEARMVKAEPVVGMEELQELLSG
jgi:hypothetical protein